LLEELDAVSKNDSSKAVSAKILSLFNVHEFSQQTVQLALADGEDEEPNVSADAPSYFENCIRFLQKKALRTEEYKYYVDLLFRYEYFFFFFE
jgi:hypothetical protein